MEPEIKNFPAFKAVGLKYTGKNESNEIQTLWDEFISRLHEIKNTSKSGHTFGIYSKIDETDYDKEFDYTACIEVDKFEEVPDKMIMIEIREGRYAVFTHRGSIKKILETDEFIFKKWMKETDIEIDGSRYDFEFYNENFKGEADDSEVYIYIPIK